MKDLDGADGGDNESGSDEGEDWCGWLYHLSKLKVTLALM